MADIKPFQALRPAKEYASRIAALPYDVFNREEAKEEIKREPMSFLRVDRADALFDDSVEPYDEKVYEKAKEILDDMIKKGELIQEKKACYYVYELIMDGRSQTGLVACASIDDYLNNVIKKHENTREEKEEDRIRHVDVCDAQTGPIFLAYRSCDEINQVVSEVKQGEALYSFRAPDGIIHNVWVIEEEKQSERIRKAFRGIDRIYIADGHHRAASAVKVGLMRRKNVASYTGKEEFNYFLSVLFPEDQLMILPYNRVVKDLNGYDLKGFFTAVEQYFTVEKLGKEPYAPDEKGTFGMYTDGEWYKLKARENIRNFKDPVEALDVSLLQKYLFDEILGIKDPRTDNRIDFIGGIRGLQELERRVKEGMAAAFSMFPTGIEELFAVSDAGRLMPPKSTWFEPKLRSGLFIHKLSETETV